MELCLTKLENYIKELENKIEMFKAKELQQKNGDLVKVMLINNNLFPYLL